MELIVFLVFVVLIVLINIEEIKIDMGVMLDDIV